VRLADFILANTEPIVAEWETFARGIWPGAEADSLALRAHSEGILRASARDMMSDQTAGQQSDKSKGRGPTMEDGVGLSGASDVHALARVNSGFDLLGIVAEYRALRASVIRLWRESRPHPDRCDLDDLTRFNESIDQGLATAVRSYTQRVDRSRQMFLAILGHDLRNPLTSIIMSADVLARRGDLDEDASAMISQIAAGVAVMDRMIVDLLIFTGAGLGAEVPLSPAAMDLGDLCREVINEMHAGYPARELRVELQGDLTGEWDAARLRQVVSNLLGNAVQHGAETGPVELCVRSVGPEAVLSVRNGGPPIAPDVLPTIFDPLVRAVASTPEMRRQRRPGSIGLGLYIARAVVTAHGGTIDVSSSAGTGTLFTVRLPRRGDKIAA
jgi:signal transduction histidine kinase